MSSIVTLLQTALMLLGLAQSNPALPPSVRDSAVQTAQKAISVATTALNASYMTGPPSTSVTDVALADVIHTASTQTNNYVRTKGTVVKVMFTPDQGGSMLLTDKQGSYLLVTVPRVFANGFNFKKVAPGDDVEVRGIASFTDGPIVSNEYGISITAPYIGMMSLTDPMDFKQISFG